MGYLPCCGCVNTTVWMHNVGINNIFGEEARLDLHKNATCCLEQTLEETPNKIVALQPPTSHLKNYPDILLWTSTNGCISFGQPARA